MSDRHAIFATTTDGRRVRLSEYTTYSEAIESWTRLTNARPGVNRWFTRVPGTEGRHAEIKHVEVRSQDDPRYNTAPRSNYGVDILTAHGYTTPDGLGRAIVRRKKIASLGGGWFRNPRGGKVQGLREIVAIYGGSLILDGKWYGIEKHVRP